jgi:hypothetical protein
MMVLTLCMVQSGLQKVVREQIYSKCVVNYCHVLVKLDGIFRAGQ